MGETRRKRPFVGARITGTGRPSRADSWPRQRVIGLTRKRSFVAARVPVIPTSGSRQFVEKRLRFFEIGGAEARGEPAVDWGEEVAGFCAAALITPQPGQARGGAQFPELGLLRRRDAQGSVIQFLGGRGMPLPQQQPPFMPVQLRRE